MSRLLAVFVAIGLVFAALVYLLILAPVLAGLEGAFGPAGDSGMYGSELDFAATVVMRIVPLVLVAGAILFAFVAAASRQARHGRGRL